MKEIINKLAKKIIDNYPDLKVLKRVNIEKDSGFLNFLEIWGYEDKYDDKICSHWVIDFYLIMFSNRLDPYKLNSAMDFLDSEDSANLIIGMNILYNIEIDK